MIPSQPAQPGIELTALIDRRPISATQVAVVALCATGLFVSGYDIQVLALTVPTLAAAWGVPESGFGWALSAVVVGITIGSALMGPLGDRFGRRTMLAITMTAIGVATLCTSLSTTPGQFIVWRLITGLALGACIPSCAALTSEYAPVANRSLIMGLMNIATPIGAFSAGFIAPPVIESFGWRGNFIIGGVAPLIVAALVLLIPESLKFLLARRPGDARIPRYLHRIAPDVDPATLRIVPIEEQRRVSPLALLSSDLRARTLLLWGLLVLNMFNLYLLVSWLPTMLQGAGWSLGDALRGAVLIQGGGIAGGLLIARFMDRGATKPALVAGFTMCACALVAFSVLDGQTAWIVLLLLVGGGVSGAQLSLNALSAAYYPPSIKATGVSWALVIGGIGSTAGPLVGARLIELGLGAASILALLAVPAAVCALAVGLMNRRWQAH